MAKSMDIIILFNFLSKSVYNKYMICRLELSKSNVLKNRFLWVGYSRKFTINEDILSNYLYYCFKL